MAYARNGRVIDILTVTSTVIPVRVEQYTANQSYSSCTASALNML